MAQSQFSFDSNFLTSPVDLPKFVHAKLVKSLTLFTRDPRHPGLNYESLHGNAERLFSLRIDQDYRLILEEIGEDNFVLVYAGKHDEAYAKAERIGKARSLWKGAKFMARVRLAPEVRLEEVDVIRLVSLGVKKYLPLSTFLREQKDSVRQLELSFDVIAQILGADLPGSAYRYQAWWANDPTHVQAVSWLSVGWKSTDRRIKDKQIKFQWA